MGQPIVNVLSHAGFVHISDADINRAIRLSILGVLSMQFGFSLLDTPCLNLLDYATTTRFGRRKSKKPDSLYGTCGNYLYMDVDERACRSRGGMDVDHDRRVASADPLRGLFVLALPPRRAQRYLE